MSYGAARTGISVVLDVAYNHTFRSYDSNFEMLVPGYYHCRFASGASDGSGCAMNSLRKTDGAQVYLDLSAFDEEYKVDGFRFDLMSLSTEKLWINRSLAQRSIRSSVRRTSGRAPALPHKQMVGREHKNKGFALFNDDFRNAPRGGSDKTPGYTRQLRQTGCGNRYHRSIAFRKEEGLRQNRRHQLLQQPR